MSSSSQSPAPVGRVTGPLTGLLRIIVHCARDLPSKQLIGTMDPYITARLKSETLKSAVHKDGGRTPHWEHAFVMNLKGYDEHEILHFEVMNKEMLSDDTIGLASVELKDIVTFHNVRRWYQLVHKHNFSHIAGAFEATIDYQGSGVEWFVQARPAAQPAYTTPAPAQPAPVYQPPPATSPAYSPPPAAAQPYQPAPAGAYPPPAQPYGAAQAYMPPTGYPQPYPAAQPYQPAGAQPYYPPAGAQPYGQPYGGYPPMAQPAYGAPPQPYPAYGAPQPYPVYAAAPQPTIVYGGAPQPQVVEIIQQPAYNPGLGVEQAILRAEERELMREERELIREERREERREEFFGGGGYY